MQEEVGELAGERSQRQPDTIEVPLAPANAVEAAVYAFHSVALSPSQ